MTDCSIPCLVCSKELQNFSENSDNHPMSGLEFVTYGHYGSTEFDPMDGKSLVINICDVCIKWAIENNKVLESVPAPEVRRSSRILTMRKSQA